ncbi:MAG: DUF3795 domain-containing protein [Ruminococcaceae bacterium]|nr:DUF3795 domain-containing protein [Oscillospiraceae bacterium]
MKMPLTIAGGLVAPCGVNCLACSAYLSVKNPCPGCRAPHEAHKRKSCQNCVKKKCAFEKGLQWCFECSRFPCARIKDLSRRYSGHYGIDLIQNGEDARRDMPAFLAAQRQRFLCGACGGVIDQHHGRCSDCGAPG